LHFRCSLASYFFYSYPLRIIRYRYVFVKKILACLPCLSVADIDGLPSGYVEWPQMAARSGDHDKVDPALIREVMRELGRRGGTKRAARLTKEQRKESARRAVLARWARTKNKKKPRADRES
jgi:hypothetical protein